MRIKVCGVTNPDEAREIARLGVDAIGLVFAKSPRQVDAQTARRIVDAIPPFVQTVGVFVNEEAERIRELIDYCGLDLVQFHGHEGPDECKAFAPRVIKAVRLRSRADIQALISYQDAVRAFLLDTWSPHVYGGSGETFDWSLAVEAKEMLSRPIILAGGLRPENCAEAIGIVHPWGVDVSSGVEMTPGKKDMKRVRWFIETVKLFSRVV
ncbi:MAG: phosphoribosylanthranilate isomerase [Dissulfurimicrobium sp.]|uniref:phosphoribosylanthranilate isomerase n=1 Tax=Dissulfurimicrobium sp. TaxID=2022436 RepID=UPI004049DDE7